MIKKISQFFTDFHNNAISSDSEEQALTLEVACVVLLCEVMRADGVMSEDEQIYISKQVSKLFSLEREEVNELIEKACHLSEQAIDFHQFTSLLNQHYDAAQKTHMVTLLWQLAISDGEIATIEEHIIRRIADLLHLSRAEYIRAKNTVISPK